MKDNIKGNVNIKLPQISDLANMEANTMLSIAEDYAKLCKDISVNQIRNLYSSLNAIKMKFKKLPYEAYINKLLSPNEKIRCDYEIKAIYANILRLKLMAYYAAGKEGKDKNYDKYLRPFIVEILDNTKEDIISINKFFELIESFVGYHKYYEIKRNK